MDLLKCFMLLEKELIARPFYFRGLCDITYAMMCKHLITKEQRIEMKGVFMKYNPNQSQYGYYWPLNKYGYEQRLIFLEAIIQDFIHEQRK